MTETQALNELITKWKLNQSLLAEKLGMKPGTFSNNLLGRKYYNFTEEQLKSLKRVLKELKMDLEKTIK